jgi:hypothetical protein
MPLASRQHRYSLADIVTAAKMAGGGSSADEIARAIGRGMTVKDVYQIMYRYGISMVPKARTQVCVPLVFSREAMEAASIIAEKMGEDPQWLAARILEATITDRATVAKVLEWIDPR